MALGPPLYRPGNKRCPKCGKSQWWHLLTGLSWRGWHCSGCRSSLDWDHRRQLVSYLLWVVFCAYVFVSSVFLQPWRVWHWVTFAALLAAVWFLRWWLDSVRLISAPDQASSKVNPKG